MRQSIQSRAAFWLLAIVTVILVLGALKALKSVALVVVFAAFITLVMSPLDRRIVEALPDPLTWLGRAAVMSVLLAVLGIFLAGLVYAARQVMDAMPRITEDLGQMLPLDVLEGNGTGDGSAGDGPNDGFLDLPGSLQSAGGAFGGWLTDTAMSLAQAVVNTTGSLVAFIVIVFFLVLLALGEVPLFRSKIDALSAGAGRETWHDVTRSIAMRLRRFLLVRALMGLLSAVLYVGWLAIFGIDLLFVWAILTFLLTFIPNIGSIISGLLPVLYAFLVVDVWTATAVGAGIFVIEQVIGNFVDPKLQGRQIVLSPFVILVAILFWGWLWGVAGAFLAVPMTSTILVVCAHVPSLRPAALLLSNQKDEADLDEALGD